MRIPFGYVFLAGVVEEPQDVVANLREGLVCRVGRGGCSPVFLVDGVRAAAYSPTVGGGRDPGGTHHGRVEVRCVIARDVVIALRETREALVGSLEGE